MHIVRHGLLVILTPLFLLLLFVTAFDWGIVSTVGRPAAVKQIVSESGIYSSVIPNLLTQVKQVDTNVGNLAASDPVVSTAANQAFSPQYVQKNTETIIDSIYAWLEGKTTEPNFKINLSDAKLNFANSLATQYQQKAATLPTCTTPFTSTSFDISSATCLPAGVSADSVGQAIKNDLAGDNSFIKNPVINASSIKGDKSNKPLFEGKLKDLPSQYQRVKKTPAILIVLSILTAIAIFFLSPNHLKGLRHLGIVLLIVGILMLVFSWGLNKGVNTQLLPELSIKDNPVMTRQVRTLATDITQRIDKNYWTFGVIYTALGAAALAAPILIRRGPPQEENSSTENETTPS